MAEVKLLLILGTTQTFQGEEKFYLENCVWGKPTQL